MVNRHVKILTYVGRINDFNPDMQKLLGYRSRVPTSVSEWYSLTDKRLYK